jgi:hypothetical protein
MLARSNIAIPPHTQPVVAPLRTVRTWLARAWQIRRSASAGIEKERVGRRIQADHRDTPVIEAYASASGTSTAQTVRPATRSPRSHLARVTAQRSENRQPGPLRRAARTTAHGTTAKQRRTEATFAGAPLRRDDREAGVGFIGKAHQCLEHAGIAGGVDTGK